VVWGCEETCAEELEKLLEAPTTMPQHQRWMCVNELPQLRHQSVVIKKATLKGRMRTLCLADE
jgi:hypothetical protein